MATKSKMMRSAGCVPPDNDGPVYWRLMKYRSLTTGDSGEPLQFTESRERRVRLRIDRCKMPGKDIFLSGTVFNASGRVMPEWREPTNARWTKLGTVQVEFSGEARTTNQPE